jgi:quercetin dioxygenase-like cupin family protein
MSKDLWFLNSWVTVHLSRTAGADGVSVLEHRIPYGDSPPLHVHQTEDEIFHVLEGELRFQVGQQQHLFKAGAILLGPKGVPHTYRVESPTGARLITITAHADFERFVLAMSRPAERQALPTAAPPSPEAVKALTAAARSFGIEFVGPPLT